MSATRVAVTVVLLLLASVPAATLALPAGDEIPGPGASLLVQVRGFEGLPAAGVRVAVVASESLREVRSFEAVSRVARLAEGRSDAKGWAAFRNLRDEPVQLLAWTPDGRLAHLSPVIPLAGGAERIEQLDLERPGSVRVDLDGEATGAEVRLESVSLAPAAGTPWPRLMELRAPAGAEGAAFDSVPAGPWVVRAQARARGGHLQNIGRTEIHVQPGAPLTATLSLAGLVYRGKITGGRHPVTEGILYLERSDGGGKGNQAAEIVDGRFLVLLEEPGTFAVSVQRRDGTRVTAAEPVAFEAASKEILIRLGDAQIAGVVENSEGQPMANVRVDARRHGDDRAAQPQTRSDSAGRFVFEDLSAGTWELVARNDRLQSAELRVEALPGRTTGGIRLVLRELHHVRGTVLFANGASAAHVALFVRDSALGDAAITTMTDERGAFELRHAEPLDGKVVNVFVRLGDRQGFAKRIPLRDGMTLTVPRSGTVAFRRGDADAPWQSGTMTDHVLVAQDGAWVHPMSVGRVEGDRLVVALPAGVWRYVVISSPAERQLLRRGAGTSLPAVSTFVVQESARSEVEIAFSRAQRKETR